MLFISEFSSKDRSANYGDGLFTTIKVLDGVAVNQEQHMLRLSHDSMALNIVIDLNEINRVINARAKKIGTGVLKVFISAGSGGRGYARADEMQPLCCITEHALPEHYDSWREQGIALRVSDVSLARQPLLAGLKHANRLEQVLVKQWLNQYQEHDALVLDTEDYIVEASAANIFWYKEKRWFTPSLKHCGVAGIQRGLIVEFCRENNIKLTIGEFSLSSILNAEAIFICNALMGIVPVVKLTHGDSSYCFLKDDVHALSRLLSNKMD